jgi:uncharacterized repeat protein (TIGR03943 family)
MKHMRRVDECTEGSTWSPPATTSAVSVVLLAALGLLLLAKWRAGHLDFYVHPGFVPVLALTGVLLVLFAAARWLLLARHLSSHGHGHGTAPAAWSLAVVALAVVVAALVPARPLGSLAADGQASDLPPTTLAALTDETESWTLLEWAQALGGGIRRERLIGRRVSLVGFVHRPRQGGRPGEVQVARFVVRCCAADGLAVSLPVRHPDADALATDTWVRVEGALRLSSDRAPGTAYVEADRLTPVPVPDVPYLTPT